jgi:hypothetical protein
MSIHDSHPTLPADPGARWAAVKDFVQRCRLWSVAELERRAADGRPTAEWESYLKFTDHTLQELDNGTLDHWFRGAGQ